MIKVFINIDGDTFTRTCKDWRFNHDSKTLELFNGIVERKSPNVTSHRQAVTEMISFSNITTVNIEFKYDEEEVDNA